MGRFNGICIVQSDEDSGGQQRECKWRETINGEEDEVFRHSCLINVGRSVGDGMFD